MFQKKVVQKIKTQILCPVPFFFYKNRDVYEIMWEYIVEWGRPQTAVWRMRILCWINKTTHKLSEYVILIAFPLQQRMHEHALMLRYTFLACLVYCDVSSCHQFAAVGRPAREDAQRARQNVVHAASCLPATSRSYTNTNTTLRDHQMLIDTGGNYSHQDH
jgi:hypothetical protein